MPFLQTVQGKTPHWGERCFLADNATLAGDITMGDDCSVWYGAVIRADVDAVVIGNRVNVQDCACIHQTAGFPVVLGDDVSVGHGAVVDGADIGEHAIVAAGAVVLAGTRVGPCEIWAGVPARRVKVARPEQAGAYAEHYMYIKEWYRQP